MTGTDQASPYVDDEHRPHADALVESECRRRIVGVDVEDRADPALTVIAGERLPK